MIKEFQGDFRWLSNFWPCRVEFEGLQYPSVENAYQAAKFSPDLRKPFQTCRPGEAKRMGKKGIGFIGTGWAGKTIELMTLLNEQKYSEKNPALLQKLLATGTEELQEGNRWNDEFWGVNLNTGVGRNELGKILMQIREKRRESE